MSSSKRPRHSRMTPLQASALKAKFLAPSVPNDEEGNSSASSANRVICIACRESVANSTTRMMSHLNSTCKAINNRLVPGNGFVKRFNESQSHSLSGASTNICGRSAASAQSSITSLVPKLQWSRADTENAEFLFGKAVILSGSTFSCFDNEHFRAAFKSLPVNFHPVSAEYLSTTILSKVYDGIQYQVVCQIVQHLPLRYPQTDGLAASISRSTI